MKKPLSEERIRKLISTVKIPLEHFHEQFTQHEFWRGSKEHGDIIRALIEIEHIERELGEYEDPKYKTELKQIEIPY